MIYWILLILLVAGVISYSVVKRRKEGRLTEKTRDCIVFQVLAVVCFVILFWQCLFGGMQLSYTNMNYAFAPFSSLGVNTSGPLLSDVADYFLPDIWRIINQWDFSLWNESTGLGFPVQTEIFLHPLNYVYLFGMEFGQTIKYVLEYILAFIGIYLFLDSLKLSRTAAYLGGIVYTFCSVMVMWGGWPHSDVTALGPWLFFLVERFLQVYTQLGELRLKYCLGFITVLWIMLVAGMPTYVPFFLYLGIIYTFYRCIFLFGKEQYFKKILPVLMLLGGSVVIAALMSFLYTGTLFFATSEYQAERSTTSNFVTLSIEYIRTLFFPYDREGFTMHPNECTIYAGPLVGLVLSILLFFTRKKDDEHRMQLNFWHATAWIALLMVFTSGSGHLYQYIPLLNSSMKIRVLVVVCFAASILTGLVCNGLIRGTLYCENKLKTAAAILGVPVLLAVIYGNLQTNLKYYGMLGIIVFVLLLVLWQKKKVYQYLLCLAVTVNMAGFAQTYIPMIDANAPAIPEPTESIVFLQNETEQSHTRVLSLGKWYFFPQMNTYYGLEQLASHNLNNTSAYLEKYMVAIDPSCYKSPTRTEFSQIQNENLLSYASVEYILSSEQSALSTIDDMIQENNTKRTPIVYDGSTPLQQSFIAADENLPVFNVLLSTYSKELSDQDYIQITVVREETRERIAQGSLNLGDVQDNQVHSIQIEQFLPCVPGETLVMQWTAQKPFQLPLALWITEDDIYDGELSIGEVRYAGDLSMCINQTDNLFADGQTVRQLAETSPRAFFASDILVQESAEQVLEAMKADYLPNTAFITQDIAQVHQITAQQQTKSSGTITDYSSTGDHVTMHLSSNGGGMVVLNDYYDDDWTAYVNGQKTEVVRTNYLFRGISIPEAGEYDIQFVYEPTQLYLFAGVSAAGFVLWIALIVFRKKLEAIINRNGR